MSNPAQIRIFSVDDHPLMREGIAAIIRNEADMTLVAEATCGREAIQGFRDHRPDVTLMDLRMPDISGIDAMVAIRTEFPNARIIMLTTSEGDVEIKQALQAGAQGYMLKTMPRKQLVEMIRKVHAGKKHIPHEVAANIAEHMSDEALSKREVEVLRKIADGNRNSDIAALLFVSEETIKGHVKHIMEKLGASDRTEAVAIGIRRGIIQL
jgi:DNA-binding NarL/FixJ family response regulator